MKVGFTCSCFDMLHAGHVLMLKEAKTVCDYLIVGLQSDPTLDRPEKNKPVQGLFERYTQLSGIKYVDEIVVYDTEFDLKNVLRALPIDIRIIGEDYRDREKPFTGHDLPIEVYYNSRKHDFSTTFLRKRVNDRLTDKSI